MQKIDKSIILSKGYETWLQDLRDKNKEHRTCSKYRTDVVMSLLYCQRGVCAYTEMRLCAPDLITEDKWNETEYIKRAANRDITGDLEHFDPTIKKEFHCEWDNLFMIHHKVNILKNDSNIEFIKPYKPDSEGYNPHEIFDYDSETNRFRPNSDIEDKAEVERIKKLLKLLSINQGFVCYERKTFFNDVKYNKNKSIDRFYTAYEMIQTPCRIERDFK